MGATLLAAAASPAAAGGGGALATVDKEPITAQDLAEYRQALDSQKATEGAPGLDRSVLLEELINRHLLLQAAKEQGLTTEPEVREAIERARERILIRTLLDRTIADRVSPKRVEAFYRDHFAGTEGVVQIQVVRRRAATRARAEKLRSGLQDPKAEGEWVLLDLQPPALAEALGEAQEGQVVGPLANDGGWILARVLARRKVPPPPLDQIREPIRKRLEEKAIRDLLARLRKEARITYRQASESR